LKIQISGKEIPVDKETLLQLLIKNMERMTIESEDLKGILKFVHEKEKAEMGDFPCATFLDDFDEWLESRVCLYRSGRDPL